MAHDNVFEKIYGHFTPKTYDAHCLREVKENLKKDFIKSEKMIVDNHYPSFGTRWKYLKLLYRYIKSKKNPLSAVQEKYNDEITYERQKIETQIGLLKKRFEILNTNYRRGNRPHFEIITIATAIYNLKTKEINTRRKVYAKK
jgi:NAD+--asparagine ADP-ribosyltransferase